jgi:hypothetical protein
MNRYIFICRIKWPVMLVVFGITALLNEWGILSYGESWPLYLIAFGLLQLAERAAWSQSQVPPAPYPGTPGGYTGPYTGQPGTGQRGGWGGPSGPPSSTALSITPSDVTRQDKERT